MKLMRLFATPLCFLFSSLLIGQSESIKKIVPITPEMSGLFRRVEIPLNHSSGTINYQINLYTLKLKNISLPINLNYSSNGFKPSENSSNVGLGWDVEVGGKISHNVQGMNDLTAPNLLSVLPNGFPVDRTLNMYFSGQNWRSQPDYEILTSILSNYILNYNQEFISNWNMKVDTQPDIFYYSYPGGQGKFFLDNNLDTGHQMPAGKELIKYGNNKFTITDTYGNIYEYAKSDILEQTSAVVLISGMHADGTNTTTNFHNNFYLTRIITPGETVVFAYENVEYGYENTETFTKGSSKDYNLPNNGCITIGTSTPTTSYTQDYELKNISSLKHTYPVLKTISINGFEKIEFIYDSVPRIDLKNNYQNKARALKKIVIKDKHEVNTLTFNQSYFTSTLVGDQYQKNWLKLNSVSKNDENYQFQYYEGDLPTKNTEKIDYWGFYNFQRNQRYSMSDFKETFYSYDNTPNKEYTQLTLLKKIIYPTSGEEEFIYGSNSYNEPNYKEYATSINSYILGYSPEMSDELGRYSEEKIFQLTSPTDVEFHYFFPFLSTGFTTEQYYYYSLQNISDNTYVNIPAGKTYHITRLEPGTYKMKLEAVVSSPENSTI